MKSIWILIIIGWIIWKVVKPALEEAQRRSQKPPPQSLRKKPPLPHRQEPLSAPGLPRKQDPFAQRQPQQRRPATTAGGMSDMERLFAEAMERKRGLEHAPERGRPHLARPRPVQQRPEPEPEEWIPPAPEPEPDPWIPARPEPRREHKVERAHRAPGRKHKVVMPAGEPPTVPPAPARVRTRAKPRRRIAQRGPARGVPIIGTWGRNNVRKGIILAEILGPPKALKDIDSHVI